MYEIIFILILAAIIFIQLALAFIMMSKHVKKVKKLTDYTAASLIATMKIVTVVSEATKYFNETYDVQLSFDYDKKTQQYKFTITDPENGEKIFATRLPKKQSEENAENVTQN